MTAVKDHRHPTPIRIVSDVDARSEWDRIDAGLRRTVLVVVGTRPEVIKLAPVVRALESDGRLAVELCVVGQQGEILEQALNEWDLVPDHRVEIPTGDRRLAGVLGAMLPQLADVIERVRPEMVLVEGDTTTNLGTALAAFYAGVPVGHVEAGLRSGDVRQPFPEEMHRVLVDRLSSVHYAPTTGARQNLLDENHRNPADVLVVGNTVVDALLMTLREGPPQPARDPNHKVLLVTAHRRENFGAGIASICDAVRTLCAQRADLKVVFVLHTNPQAFAPVRAALSGLDNVELIKPQPYRSFVRLLAAADVILTDSGGIQEEAPYLGKPVIVTRQVTERPEASQAGAASIVGTDAATIVSAVNHVLDDELVRETMSRRLMPYGDGHASARIVHDIAGRLMPAEFLEGEQVPGVAMSDPEAAEAAGIKSRALANSEVAS